VRFHAHIRQHSTKNNFAYCSFSQLQNKIICLRAENLMGAGNDRHAIIDEWLELLQPVGTRIFKIC